MSTNASLGSNLHIEYWIMVSTFKILYIRIQDGVPIMEVVSVLDVIVKPDNYKIKLIPSVAEYIYICLKEWMFELIF